MSARRRLAATVAAMAGLALTTSAAVWQYGRGQEKDRISAEASAGARDAPIEIGDSAVSEATLRYRRVVVTGEFQPESVVLLDNQTRGAQPGFVVYTALALSGGRHVLVKRGWIAGSPDRSLIPVVATPSGRVSVEGMALPPASRFLELAEPALDGRVWQNVTVERYERRFGKSFQPLIVEQTNDTGDGLVRQWPQPASGSAKHYGYAFQWAAMAALIVVFYVYFSVRKRSSATLPP